MKWSQTNKVFDSSICNVNDSFGALTHAMLGRHQ